MKHLLALSALLVTFGVQAAESAPTPIPHSVDGLLPITKDRNACVACHKKAGPTMQYAGSVPASHYDKDGNLQKFRYDCSFCHVPMKSFSTYKPEADLNTPAK